MRRLIMTCLLVALATQARAEPARSWIFDDNPESPSLGYGVPDSDDLVLAIYCEPADKRMTIVESIAAPKLTPGRKATFKLTAGTETLELSGDATANESDGATSVEVTSAPNPRLFAVLKAGPSLTIAVADASETIPLTGAGPHVVAMEKLCAGKK